MKFMITVNDSIGTIYKDEYNVKPLIIRNIPFKNVSVLQQERLKLSKIELDELKRLTKKQLILPEKKPVIILQGAGININRGAEEAVLAMQYTEDVILLIVGDGDVIKTLKATVKNLELDEKVRFITRQPFQILSNYTSIAEFGISFDKDTNINYKFSLPNKLFDYINAGIPIVASPLPEVKKIIEHYQCGTFIRSHIPEDIAACFTSLLNDKERLWRYHENAIKAAEQLDGEKELMPLYELALKLKK
jgi:glycosyltransferase involved in cell wall biosynthesis